MSLGFMNHAPVPRSQRGCGRLAQPSSRFPFQNLTAKTGRPLCVRLPFPTLVTAMSAYQHASPSFSKPSSVHIPHKQLPGATHALRSAHTDGAKRLGGWKKGKATESSDWTGGCLSPGLEGEAQGNPRRDLGAPCAVRRGQAEGDQSGPLRADSPAQGPHSFECTGHTAHRYTHTHSHTHTHTLSLFVF